MNFIIMGYERRGEWAHLPAEEQQRRIRKHQEGLIRLFGERSAAGKPHLTMSVGLHDIERANFPLEMSTKLRYDGKRAAITDGPFTESKEVLAGFDLINFDSREEAIEWKQSLGFDHEGQVTEIRAVQGGGLIYHGHRPTASRKYLLLFGKNPRPGVREMHDRAATEYVHQGFLDEAICLASARLAEPKEACTMRLRDGKNIVTDGPFAEGREVIGGLVVLDCPTREAALEWARRFTAIEGAVTEVMPCGMWWSQLI
jgi:hypothetical protein